LTLFTRLQRWEGTYVGPPCCSHYRLHER